MGWLSHGERVKFEKQNIILGYISGQGRSRATTNWLKKALFFCKIAFLSGEGYFIICDEFYTVRMVGGDDAVTGHVSNLLCDANYDL